RNSLPWSLSQSMGINPSRRSAPDPGAWPKRAQGIREAARSGSSLSSLMACFSSVRARVLILAWTRESFRIVCRFQREPGEYHRGLADVLHLQAFHGIHVGVVRADVVVVVVLNGIEAGDAVVDKREVIGAADRLDVVAPRSVFLPRFEPRVELSLHAR